MSPKKVSEETALKGAFSAARNLLIIVGVFSFFINILMLVGPLYMLQIYDRVLASRSQDTLLALTALAVVLIGVGAILELVRSRILVRLGARFDHHLNESVFSALFNHQLKGRSANGVQFLRDVDTLRGFLTSAGVLAFFDSPWTPAFIALIFMFHPLLGCVALVGALLLFTLAVVSEIRTRTPLQASAMHTLKAHEFASSALRNAEALRAMGMMPRVRRHWLDQHAGGLALQERAADSAGSLTSIAKFIRPCLQIAMLGFGAYFVMQEAITAGVMIASSILMGRALAPVEAAINNWRQFISARGCYARLQQLLVANPPQRKPLPLPKPAGNLKIEGATALPPQGGKPVLQGVNFELRPGQMLGVIGPSAAGKSTLARLLVGVWQPASGHVRLDGADLSNWRPDELGPHVGYLPQDIELQSGTVGENIARLGQPEPAQVVAAAKLCDAHEMILRLPDGYDTQIGEAGCILSAGQRQRIALARALYGDPCLVVLDEPNANLDSDGEAALNKALLRLKERKQAVVVISHRPSVLTAVDLLLILRGGQVEAFGPREEILPRLMGSVQPMKTVRPANSASRMSGG